MEFNATFLVSIISFIVFVLIMNAIFYKPLQKIVDERQKFVDETNEEAKKHKAKAEAILKDKAKKLDKTKIEAKKIISKKTEEVKSQKDSLTSEAKEKSAQKVEVAKADLQKSNEEAQKALEGEVQNLAQAISTKILGEVNG